MLRLSSIFLAVLLLGGWTFTDTDDPSDAATEPIAVNWQQLPGEARDIGANAEGSVWVVGKDRSIYRWNEESYNWAQASGSNARRIAVGPNETPWITNTSDEVYKFRGGNWQQMPGQARDIGAGADSSVWVVGSDKGVYEWNESAFDWTARSGSGVAITVTDEGTPWLVNDKNEIYKWRGGGWQQMPGQAIDIAAGPEGAVWVIGDNDGIYKWNESAFDWQKVSGSGRRIAVSGDGTPWIVNADNEIFRGRGV